MFPSPGANYSIYCSLRRERGTCLVYRHEMREKDAYRHARGGKKGGIEVLIK